MLSQLRVEMCLLVQLLLKQISKQLFLSDGLTMRENNEFVLFENASLVHKCLLETPLSSQQQNSDHFNVKP